MTSGRLAGKAFDIKTYSRPEDIVVASSSGNAVIADCISFPDLQTDIFNAHNNVLGFETNVVALVVFAFGDIPYVVMPFLV